MREYKIFWKLTEYKETGVLADSLEEARIRANNIEATDIKSNWEIDYIENSYNE